VSEPCRLFGCRRTTWYIVVVEPYDNRGRLDEDERVLHQLGFHAAPRVY
jgi:hypothetical protein